MARAVEKLALEYEEWSACGDVRCGVSWKQNLSTDVEAVSERALGLSQGRASQTARRPVRRLWAGVCLLACLRNVMKTRVSSSEQR